MPRQPSIDLSKYTKDPIILEGHFTFSSEPIIAEGKIIDVDFLGEKFKAKVIAIKFEDGIWAASFERI